MATLQPQFSLSSASVDNARTVLKEAPSLRCVPGFTLREKLLEPRYRGRLHPACISANSER